MQTFYTYPSVYVARCCALCFVSSKQGLASSLFFQLFCLWNMFYLYQDVFIYGTVKDIVYWIAIQFHLCIVLCNIGTFDLIYELLLHFSFIMNYEFQSQKSNFQLLLLGYRSIFSPVSAPYYLLSVCLSIIFSLNFIFPLDDAIRLHSLVNR
jgi:hypothetical protein